MIEAFIANWWPQITALIVLVAYLSRQNAATHERLNALEDKMRSIWAEHNRIVDYLLNKKEK
jgi:hypothetical protein